MSTSPALKNFRGCIAEVRILLSLCNQNEEDRIALANIRERNEALCRAAIVLLCSHIEGYFENLVESTLQFHEMNATHNRALPLSIKVAHLWKLVDLSEGTNAEAKWHALQAVKQSVIGDEESVCVKGMFNLESLIRGFASPGSKEVEKLLATIGIMSIWDQVEGRSGSRILKGALDALVHRRHPIAHGDSSAKATPADVNQCIDDMLCLAEVCDQIVRDEIVQQNGGTDPWVLLEHSI